MDDDRQSATEWFQHLLFQVRSALATELSLHQRAFPLALAQLVLLADPPLLSSNMSAVAEEFGFDGPERDEKLGGIVSVVFFTCGAISSLAIGQLADIMDRTTLVCLCLLVGSTGTFASSQAGGFVSLLFGRGAVGFAAGGLMPTSFAIIGDLYSADERPHAIAMVGILSGFGISIGQALAGFVGTSAGWRAPFAIVGVAGWCVAVLVFFIQREPRRTSEQPAQENTTWRAALSRPTVVCSCLQSIFACVPWSVVGTFFTDYLAVDAGMGVPAATTVLFSMGVGCVSGTVTGGKLGQYLYKKDKRCQAWLMGFTVWAGMLPFLLLFVAGSSGQPLMYHGLSFLGVFLASVSPVNLKAILLNAVPTQARGRVFGVFNIMDDLGRGLGPALVASWVRQLGRRNSFMLGMLFWLPSGLFCLLLTRTIPQDDLSDKRDEEGCSMLP